MSIAELSPTQFLIAVVVAALLAMAIFAHASRHGSKHATAWGVATFLVAGIAVPVYFIRYFLGRRRRS
jgi:Zn-dependent protease